MIKPGWTRVNFNYFISEEEFSYIVKAVHLIANEGWRLLGQYAVDPSTAVWRHRADSGAAPMALADIAYDGAAMSYPQRRLVESPDRLPSYLSAAHRILAEPPTTFDGEPIVLSPSAEALRWFPFPSEV